MMVHRARLLTSSVLLICAVVLTLVICGMAEALEDQGEPAVKGNTGGDARLWINVTYVLSEDKKPAARVIIDGVTYDDENTLGGHLKKRADEAGRNADGSSKLKVAVRTDGRLPHSFVRSVFQTLVKAGILDVVVPYDDPVVRDTRAKGQPSFRDVSIGDLPAISYRWSDLQKVEIPERDLPYDPEYGLRESVGLWGSVEGLAISGDGEVAIASHEGLFIWRSGKLRCFTARNEDVSGRSLEGNSPLPYPWVKGVTYDRTGRLWVATGQGLFTYHEGKCRILQCSAKYDYQQCFESICRTCDGRIVVGGRLGILVIIDPKTDEFKSFCLASDVNCWVTAVCETPDGTIWFSIINGGILRYDRAGKLSGLPLNQPWLPSQYVYALHVDEAGTVWAGCQEGLGFYRADGKGEQVPAKTLPDAFVFQLLAYEKGVLVRTKKGLALYDGKWSYDDSSGSAALVLGPDGALWMADREGVRRTKLTFSPDNPVVSRLEKARQLVEARLPQKLHSGFKAETDANGGTWLTSENQLWHHDGRTWVDRSLLLEGKNVSLLQKDSRNRLWLGTLGAGLVELNTDPLRRFNHHKEKMLAYIRSVCEHPDGGLFVGSGYGLYLLTADGAWRRLMNEVDINHIAIDGEGRVWCYSHHGGLYVLVKGMVRMLTAHPALTGLLSVDSLKRAGDGIVHLSGRKRTRNGPQSIDVALDQDVLKAFAPEPDMLALSKESVLAIRILREADQTKFSFSNGTAIGWRDIFRILMGIAEAGGDERVIKKSAIVYVPGDLKEDELSNFRNALKHFGVTAVQLKTTP